MPSILGIFAGIVSIVQSVLGIFTSRKERQDAKNEVLVEIHDKEAQAANATAEVMAEYRAPDDGSKRLRDGKF